MGIEHLTGKAGLQPAISLVCWPVCRSHRAGSFHLLADSQNRDCLFAQDVARAFLPRVRSLAKWGKPTMKREPELRADFIAEAETAHRSASQVMRELMREYVVRQRQSREDEDFLP